MLEGEGSGGDNGTDGGDLHLLKDAVPLFSMKNSWEPQIL
jgi:hypothetical protein